MYRVRNAVIIIILCIIGAYTARKGPQLSMNMPDSDVKDAVAGHRSHRRPGLTLASGKSDDLRDAVAGHAVGTPNHGNTLDDVGPPPRGNGEGGFGPQSNNPGNNFTPPPGPVSPSGPEETPPSHECNDCQYCCSVRFRWRARSLRGLGSLSKSVSRQLSRIGKDKCAR